MSVRAPNKVVQTLSRAWLHILPPLDVVLPVLPEPLRPARRRFAEVLRKPTPFPYCLLTFHCLST